MNILSLKRSSPPSQNHAHAEADACIRNAQNGDHAAFERLYRLHVDRVYSLALLMAANKAAADEITQRVFVTLWRKLSSFRWDCAFSTWLHRVAVNQALNYMRAESRREKRIFFAETPGDFEKNHLNSYADEKLDLQEAIQKLPERARVIFTLHDVEGFKHKEIATMLGIATGSSKAHLHRARTLLREALKK